MNKRSVARTRVRRVETDTRSARRSIFALQGSTNQTSMICTQHPRATDPASASHGTRMSMKRGTHRMTHTPSLFALPPLRLFWKLLGSVCAAAHCRLVHVCTRRGVVHG